MLISRLSFTFLIFRLQVIIIKMDFQSKSEVISTFIASVPVPEFKHVLLMKNYLESLPQ